MTYDPRRHHRRSIRLPGYDYASAGAYFVTVVTDGRACLFGDVHAGVMVPTEIGQIVEAAWRSLPAKYPHLEVDDFVLMPNHLHGIVAVGAGSPRPTLGQILGFLKYQTTVAVNAVRRCPGTRLWQRNYYEHIVRTDASRDRICEYMRTNPERWSADRENPAGDGTDDVEAWVRTRSVEPHAGPAQGGGTPPLQAIDDFIRFIDEWGPHV